jgi:cysteine desulfurase
MDSIYLDHNATTPTRPEVVEAMAKCLAEGYANPASQHQPGQRARRVLEEGRERIAEILGANLSCPQPDRLVLTSGGTEANNLAILGIAKARAQRAREPQSAEGKALAPSSAPHVTCDQVIFSAIEHASVIEPAENLLEQGWRLDTVGVTEDGVVHAEQLRSLLTRQTRLVSVMLGNHETGVLQPVAELATMCNAAGVPLHTDAVAAVGKVSIDFRGLGVAAMSFAAHKFQGPLGIGGLLLRHDIPILPLIFGGHQQRGLRPGTESVALAAGMRTALELWQKEQEEHRRRMTALRDRFESGLKSGYPGAVVHSERAPRLPHTTNIAFPGLDGQILLLALDMAGVACSVGSACASGSSELSPTLRAMGLGNGIVASSLRFSLGATTTEAELDEAIRRILEVCRQLRG